MYITIFFWASSFDVKSKSYSETVIPVANTCMFMNNSRLQHIQFHFPYHKIVQI